MLKLTLWLMMLQLICRVVHAKVYCKDGDDWLFDDACGGDDRSPHTKTLTTKLRAIDPDPGTPVEMKCVRVRLI